MLMPMRWMGRSQEQQQRCSGNVERAAARGGSRPAVWRQSCIKVAARLACSESRAREWNVIFRSRAPPVRHSGFEDSDVSGTFARSYRHTATQPLEGLWGFRVAHAEFA